MKIDGLFIEYLISGGVAILWLYPLFMILGINPTFFYTNISLLLIAIPITYIIGMMVDYLASRILARSKNEARLRVYNKAGLDVRTFYDSLFDLSYTNETLIKHLEMRESRVRTARGTFINIIFATICIPLYFFIRHDLGSGFLFLLGLLLVLLLTWRIYEKNIWLTYEYQATMIRKLQEKERINENEN